MKRHAAMIVGFGVLTWLVPFVVSIPLVDPDGGYRLPFGLFKSIMLIVGGACGTWLMVSAIKVVDENHAGLKVSVFWLAINLLLDALVLIPLSGMPWIEYTANIGLRYLTLPIVGMGLDAVRADVLRRIGR